MNYYAADWQAMRMNNASSKSLKKEKSTTSKNKQKSPGSRSNQYNTSSGQTNINKSDNMYAVDDDRSSIRFSN